jgi:hypothetical protein
MSRLILRVADARRGTKGIYPPALPKSAKKSLLTDASLSLPYETTAKMVKAKKTIQKGRVLVQSKAAAILQRTA